MILSPFYNEKTEIQRGKVICLRSQKLKAELWMELIPNKLSCVCYNDIFPLHWWEYVLNYLRIFPLRYTLALLFSETNVWKQHHGKYPILSPPPPSSDWVLCQSFSIIRVQMNKAVAGPEEILEEVFSWMDMSGKFKVPLNLTCT